MSAFEYLAVLVSIILGLALTRLLAGLGRMVHRRGRFEVDAVHLLWTLAVFWSLILNWWVFFQSQSFEEWSFDVFTVIILWAVLFFLMTVLLFPPDIGEEEDYARIFERNRDWFLGLFVAAGLTDILLTGLRGDLFDPPAYLPFAGHYVLLGCAGLFVRSRRFHVFLAGYVFTSLVIWSMVVRRFLEA